MPESIHLCDWPKAGKTDDKLEEKMKQVRDIVNSALAKRAEAEIKVRQPLSRLTIKDKLEKNLLDLIKDEVNIKEVVVGKQLKLNTKITKELEKEGEYREIVRYARELRKGIGLSHYDVLGSISSTASVVRIDDLLRDINAKRFNKVQNVEEMDVDRKKEIKLRGKRYYIGIKK